MLQRGEVMSIIKVKMSCLGNNLANLHEAQKYIEEKALEEEDERNKHWY
jgi:hypothetical protein